MAKKLKKRGSPPVKSVQSTESISSLTTPQLYSIYDQDIIKSEDVEIYEELKRSRSKSSSLEPPLHVIDEIIRHNKKSGDDNTISDGDSTNDLRPYSTNQKLLSETILPPSIGNTVPIQLDATTVGTTSPRHITPFQKATNFAFALVVLSISGIAYHQLSRNLHDNHLLHEDFASRPLLWGVKISQALSLDLLPDWFGYALEGIIFGSIIPLVDYICKVKLRPTSYSLSSVTRSINAMLGVTFGIRKVPWSSSGQAAGAWGLLNVILWLFFDGTFSMFTQCSTLGLLCCLSCFHEITDVSQFLYFMDFYFLGTLMFGKIGRYLYNL
ncbi:Protein NSG1 [Nakaseomyces bracarensis]|uniref:Protein NSG1 n=1 Tax=Nakaseomyces bracarensis TaxID=273131 RepID=A0ABR4NUN5_9SACH